MLQHVSEFRDREGQLTPQRQTVRVELLLIILVSAIFGDMVLAPYLTIFGIFEQVG